MRGGGRGGGGRQPSYAAPDGLDAAAIPAASRKMVQSLKGILADRSEGEIYATLCDCGMDPDIAVDRLISQDTFHEVRRKRDKKKETKVNQETRPRPFQKSIYRGYKAGSDRSGRDSTGGFKGPVKKEPELHAPLNSSALDVKTSDTTETFSATGNVTQADAKNTTSQPPSQVQHGWGGIPGRPSMAEIVKMGRPQAKVGSRSVASSTAMPAIGDSVISNIPNLVPKEYNRTVFASEVGHGAADKLPNGAVEVHSVPKEASSLDMLPSAEGTDIEASSMSANAQGSSTPDANEDDIEKDANLEEGNTESLTTPGQLSASGKDIQSEYTEVVSHLDEGSIEKTDDFQLNSLSFEHNQNLTGDVSTTTTQFDHLTLHEGSKLSDDDPAVIIPDHLQVSNADCAHLTFGSFVFLTLDASLTTKPLDSHGDVATVPDDDSIDQSDGRYVIVCERGSISSLPSTSSQSSHVEEAREKRDENKIDAFVAKPVTTTVFQYMKGADLVGIEEAVNDLMKILTEGNEMSMSQGKIVSIVGLGGLGKTTLAHAIYGKLRAQFDCWAFVSVSQNPDMMKLLKCMLYQLGKKNSANIHEEILDERLLIYKLTEFLQKRRYFIVIDDIQDISIWRMIKCALPATNDGCIIVTTTRVLDVAKQVGVTYRMRHLCLENSRILLHRRIFGTGDKGKYVDDELIEISEKILQRCGGIPLAIIMISGLLATKGRNKIEWDKIYRSMKYSGPDEGKMKMIVSLCYQDLPSHLKTFLLYLSVFPEGYDIDKDRLIRLWIGEGLIQCGKQDGSPFELGESYFWELINRCMIQPVYKRWYYDMTECCHMHDMVLDLISEVTGKEKLVPVWNHMHHTFHSQEVQWLSLQNSMLDHATHWATMNMQGVRSVVVFPSAVELLPDLACFRDLLVLDLQSCCLSQGCSLKHLGNLVHLRYLGLRDTGISHLSEVGKLQCLQTLDVRRNEISSLPSTVNELKHLMCLHIDSWTRAPNGIGTFTLLEELSTLCIQDSTDMIEELGNLTELRVLGIDCCTEWNVNGVEKSLVECLHKLQKIRILSISMVGECSLDAWVAPQHLLRLELTGCWLSTVPALLNDPSLLLELSFLSMEVRKLGQEDLERLGRLPALSYLDIEVGNQKLGTVQTFTIGARSFPCLVHCTLRGYIGPVVFQQGAMPEVARLHLVFPVREIRETAGINSGFDLGFGNLLRLRDVSFLLRRGGASKGEVEEAEAVLRQAIEGHPNRPTLEIL